MNVLLYIILVSHRVPRRPNPTSCDQDAGTGEASLGNSLRTWNASNDEKGLFKDFYEICT